MTLMMLSSIAEATAQRAVSRSRKCFDTVQGTTDEGYRIYTEEELGIGKGGGI